MTVPHTTADEVELVRQLLAGDEAAFVGLVERYYGSLLRLALVYVSERSIAEEVVQETWLAVLNGLHGFKGHSTLKTWMFRILTNQAKTRGVREKRSLPFSSLADPEAEYEPAVQPGRFTANGMWAAPPDSWSEDTPEKLLLRQEARTFVEREIAGLPSNQRAVVTLRDIEGLAADEVCNILEISETNQRVLLHRARSRLRGAFERYLSGK